MRASRETFAEKRARRAEIDDPAVVLDAGLRFLEPRQRSISEVRRRLVGAGYREDLVKGAIERLADLGMLDDEAFARAWVESRDRARPRGERALRGELAQRGVDRSVVDAALEARQGQAEAAPERVGEAEISGAMSADEAAAIRLLERRGRTIARVADPRSRRNRAYGLLARNGFDPGLASLVAARWAHELASDGLPGVEDVDVEGFPGG